MFYDPDEYGEKNDLFSHLCIYAIFRPRQARDKRRGHSKTDRFSAHYDDMDEEKLQGKNDAPLSSQ